VCDSKKKKKNLGRLAEEVKRTGCPRNGSTDLTKKRVGCKVYNRVWVAVLGGRVICGSHLDKKGGKTGHLLNERSG